MSLTQNGPGKAALLGLAGSFLFATVLANAHARLESTIPVADSSVSAPRLIQVHFSEAIETKLSRLKLTDGVGSAIDVKPANNASDPATLSIMPTSALKPGLYRVIWSVVSDDGHKRHGDFSFTVR